MGAAAVPAVMSGIQMAGAYIGSRKSKEEKAATRSQQQAQAMLMGQGGQLTAMGMPAQQSALGYYQTLLGGNRAAQAQAIAAPTANITDMYRGAEQNLAHKGIRGGGRDLAMAELGRGRTSQLAQLTTGVQPMAAGALGALGSQATGQGLNATGASAGIGANLVQQNFENRQNTVGMMGEGAKGMGSAIYDVWKGKKGPGSTPGAE